MREKSEGRVVEGGLRRAGGGGVLKGAQRRQNKTKQTTHQLNNTLTLRARHNSQL